jgi:predicted HTH transcriptional regulator
MPIAELQLEDIDSLTQNRVSESLYIDFKSAPIGTTDEDKREFVADVTAFANASGGDIIFGVTTQEGAASHAPGIALVDPDKEKLRLAELIRSGTERRLSYFDMKWLAMGGQKGILIVRVPRSWGAPHRVTLRGHDKFYIRNTAGKHPTECR